MADDSFVGGLSIPQCSGECEKRSSIFFDLVFYMPLWEWETSQHTYFCLNAIHPIFIYFANPIYLSFLLHEYSLCVHSKSRQI